MALTLSVEIRGDRTMFERCSQAARQPRDFMEKVGVHAMGRAVERMETVLRQDSDAVRTGHLAASLTVGTGGSGGTANTIWELSDTRVEVGSNLVYAAQVHFGGTIVPVNAKGLAIPLTDRLRRAGLGPREVDPTGELLRFQPVTGSKPNVIGVLIDDDQELTGRQKKARGGTPYGPGALFAIALSVTQQPRPYLYFDDDDERFIAEELWPGHLELV